ncbi:MAG: hypothetical protein RL199_842 [Pseudomonadota bacterium]
MRLHQLKPSPILSRLAQSEGALAAVMDDLDSVLRHPGFGEAVSRAGRVARAHWNRMPLVVTPRDGNVASADRMRWRDVARSFEEARARHGLFAAALRVALDGAEDDLETTGDDEPAHGILFRTTVRPARLRVRCGPR